METLDRETLEQSRDRSAPEYGNYELSYPEVCSEFLTALAKSVKNAALYGLAHPVVIESLRKDSALLGMLFKAKKEEALTISFMNDAWMFNESAVPAVTQESQNLNAFFKAHHLTGLTFLSGVRSFELGALCEFLSAQVKNRPESYTAEFFAEKGVTNIKPETVHYIKDNGFSRQQQSYGVASGSAPEQPRRQGSAPQTVRAAQPPQVRQAPVVRPKPVPEQPQRTTPPQQAGPAFQAPPVTVAQAPKTSPAPQPWKAAPAQMPGPAQAPSMRGPGEGSGKGTGFGPGQGPGPGKVPGPGKDFGPGGATEALFGAPQPAPPPSPKIEPARQQPSVLTNMSFGGILKGLVESAVKDPKDRVRAYEDALKMLKETMEQQISESTKTLAAEKEQVLKTRNRTERVLSRVAEGKVIVDKQGNILMMNPVAEEIAGTKLVDAVGKHISEHMRPGEHFLTLSKDMDLSEGSPVSGEVEMRGDEHMGRAMRRSVALLEDDEGRVLGTYTTLPEITKYKEAQKMQEEFLSRITHDLQSPLSSITAALEMLTDAAGTRLDPTEHKFLDISIRNSHRLSQMIRGILDFSKLQAGKMDIHPQPSLVAPIIAETAEGLIPWARTKGVTLHVRAVPEGLCAMADPPRIVEVLTNLISNAIKATPEGGSVTVAATRNPAEEGGVLFGVRDTGHGIPKESLEKLFHKFVQVSSYETQEGVGLGLVIVNDFVKLHGGRVWVESQEGKGATFYFTLPAAEMRPEM